MQKQPTIEQNSMSTVLIHTVDYIGNSDANYGVNGYKPLEKQSLTDKEDNTSTVRHSRQCKVLR